MPYKLDGNCVKKIHPDGTEETLKCYDNHEDALKYFRALEINVKQSVIAEKSMTITKASFDPKTGTMRFRMVGSDTEPDVFGERMSLELFNDFVNRIEKATPVVEPFKSVLSEKSGWDGGMPYVSVAHYKSGVDGANIPADTEKVYVDGEKLKAVAICRDNEIGKAVYAALKDDLAGTSEYEDKIRVSIGFLDLKHSHGNFIFERTTLENTCPMCENGDGNKVYLNGQLVHLALTRKPANPRTDTEVVDMAKEIKTKQEDAESIIGKALTDELEVNKSVVEEVEVLTEKAKVDVPTSMDEQDVCTGKDNCNCKLCSKKKGHGGTLEMQSEMVNIEAPVIEEESKGKYGSVEYADPKNKKYPIDTEEHIRAAWNYIHVEKNQKEYSSSEVSAIEGRIVSAWKREIDKNGPPSADTKKSEVADVDVATLVEKSALDVAVDGLKAHLEQVKSLPRDEALVQLQPDFELVAKAVQNEFPEQVVVKTELSPELSSFLQEFKTTLIDVAAKVATLSSEVAVMKSQISVGGTPPKSSIPVPTNLQIERSIVFPDLANQKPKSIKELALRSVQGQS